MDIENKLLMDGQITRTEMIDAPNIQASSGEVVEEQGYLPYIDTPSVQRLAAYLENGRSDPEKRVLYDEQVTVMEDLYAHLAQYGPELKGRIVLPTGVGKTVLFTEFIKATGLRTLVLVPTQLLLKQTEKAFEKFAGDDEISVGKVYANEKNIGESITIATYASFVQHTKDKDSPYINPDDYDVIILDEAHRALGDETKKALQEYPHIVQIGLTATENYSEKKKLSSLLPHEIHKMTIKEAVELGLICPFSVWLVETDIDMSNVRISTTNEYDQHDLQRTLNNQVRNQIAVELYIKHFMGRKATFFCSGVEHAKAVADLFQSCGVPIEAIHGGLTLRMQEALKANLADPNPATGILGLCNDKIMAEGFDEPSISVTFNLAPTLSPVRSQQRSGRSLRVDPNNPNKHTIIIEFIDTNYLKPPVLFADQQVSGTAHIGKALDFGGSEHSYEFNLASARVITNPEVVEQLAIDFAEARKDKWEDAPEEWLTVSGVQGSFNVAASIVNKALRKLKEDVPDFVKDNSGKYKARGAKDGATTYYSPGVLKGLELLIKQPEVAPEDWLTTNQIAARYDIPHAVVRKGLNEISRKRQSSVTSGIHFGEYVAIAGSAMKKHFYSPDSVQQLAQKVGKEFISNAIPKHWIADDQLGSQFGSTASKQALERMKKSSKLLMFNHSIVAEKVHYYSPEVVQRVRAETTPPRGWMSIDEIAKEQNIQLDIFEKILSQIAERFPGMFNTDSRLCWNNDKEVLYIWPAFITYIKSRLVEEQRRLSVEELGNSTPVLIPRFEVSQAPMAKSDPLVNTTFESVKETPPRSPVHQTIRSLSRTAMKNNNQRAKPPQRPLPISYLSALKRFTRTRL